MKTRTLISVFALLVVVAIAATACGGGGGSNKLSKDSSCKEWLKASEKERARVADERAQEHGYPAGSLQGSAAAGGATAACQQLVSTFGNENSQVAQFIDSSLRSLPPPASPAT